MANEQQLVMAGEIIFGSLFSEPMRIVTMASVISDTWELGVVGVQSGKIELHNYNLKTVTPNRNDMEDTRTPEEMIEITEGQGREVAEAVTGLRYCGRDLLGQDGSRVRPCE